MSREQRRLIYQIDPGRREARKAHTAKSRGSPRSYRTRRDSWTLTEVCKALSISIPTLRKFEKMGLVPPADYPTGTPRRTRYWRHQVSLLIRLFRALRKEGWPRIMPHIVGSAYWTKLIGEIHSAWPKEAFDEWQGRYSHHDGGGDD